MEKTKILMSGLGDMGTIAAEHIDRSDDFELIPWALSGKSEGFVRINYDKFLRRMPKEDWKIALPDLIKSYGPFIVVDFARETNPEMRYENADTFAKHGLDFIMGTGPDKTRIEEIIKGTGIKALVAPNSSVQIPLFQEFMMDYAILHEGKFRNCEADIIESHQAKKEKETSLTAKDVAKAINIMGIPFKVEDIKKLRTIKEHIELGVEPQYFDGHGWHNYIFTSQEGNENISFLRATFSVFLSSCPAFEKYEMEETNLSPSLERRIVERLGYLPEYAGYQKTSPDGTVSLGLVSDVENKLSVLFHNVNGRNNYGEGNLFALRYLRDKAEPEKVATMVDVTKNLR